MGFLDHTGLAYFWGKVKAALGLKMDKATYDPTGKGEDVFGYADARAAAAKSEAVSAAATDATDKAAAAEAAAKAASRPSTWMPTAAEVGADSAGTAQGLVDALPVKKLVGTAERPIDLDTLTEAGIYYFDPLIRIEEVGPFPYFDIQYIVVFSMGNGFVYQNLSYDNLDICKYNLGRAYKSSWTSWNVSMTPVVSPYSGKLDKRWLPPISTDVTATLLASAWTGTAAPFTQTVSVADLEAGANGSIGLAQSATAEQRAAAREAMLCVTGQAAGSLTVTADGVKPTVDIPVTITILG